MNFAIGALIILLILMPGIAFRYAFESLHQHSFKFFKLGFTESIPIFLVPALVVHILCLPLALSFAKIAHCQIEYDTLFYLITGGKTPDLYSFQSNGPELQIISFCWYVLATTSLGIGLATISLKWTWLNETVSKLFLVKNFYQTLFLNQQTKNDLVYVDILVQLKEGSLLYSGLFHNYYFKADSNELDTIVLKGAVRRDLRANYIKKSDTGNEKQYYSNENGPVENILSDQFLIQASQIVNINVQPKLSLDFGFLNKKDEKDLEKPELEGVGK